MIVEAMLDMQNRNVLISMAMAGEKCNPYHTFCEYVKYCVFSQPNESILEQEIRREVEHEFGLRMPHHILAMCLQMLQDDGIIQHSGHMVKRVGNFDIQQFDNIRSDYRRTEDALVTELIQYVGKYERTWNYEYARQILIRVLDEKGIAFSVFSNGIDGTDIGELSKDNDVSQSPDAERQEDTGNQEIYSDQFFVGRFVKEILENDSIKTDYLQKVCEGLMLCVGAYQLSSSGATPAVPQIKRTDFFFDTRLLLRFLGCSADSYVESVKELVSLIQHGGGNVFYFQQTFDELNWAFDEAMRNIRNGNLIDNYEMRLYASKNRNSIKLLRMKKATIRAELEKAHIYLRAHSYFEDSDRIKTGFDADDFENYIKNAQPDWNERRITNDALSIWETHMLRRGNYSEYCGTANCLPVFVTDNSRLIGLALGFRKVRPSIKGIREWKTNRLPIITDITLTCRLWSPDTQGERLSTLYLASNVVAAQCPTKPYMEKLKELVTQIGESVPEYAGITLSEYFSEEMEDTILENTKGRFEEFNVSVLASSVTELVELQKIDLEKTTTQAIEERDAAIAKNEKLIQDIVDGGVKANKDKKYPETLWLYLAKKWEWVSSVLFAGISTFASLHFGNWKLVWLILLPMSIKFLENVISSQFVTRRVIYFAFHKVDKQLAKKIRRNLREAEVPYEMDIIKIVKEQINIWKECNDFLNK